MSPEHVGLVGAVKLFFSNYFNFSGRSTRSEYWWWTLVSCVVGMVLSGIGAAAESSALAILSLVWMLATLIPGIALVFRRLHDTGKSGAWILIALVPLVGAIILLVFMVMGSAPKNQWGDPA